MDISESDGSLENFVNNFLWVFVFYGICYLILPLGRFIWTRWMNKRIEQRNIERCQFVSKLLHDIINLRSKLEFAKQHSLKMTIPFNDVIFSTSTEYPELELKAFQEQIMLEEQ